MTEPKTDRLKKGDGCKKHKFLIKKGRMKAKKRKQTERIESLFTEEKSERMRLSDARVERTDL